MNDINRKEPQLKGNNIPFWWNHRGVSVKPERSGNGVLVLASETVRVRITPDAKDSRIFVLRYEVEHSQNISCSGTILMSDEQLQTSFGLSDVCYAMWGQEIIDFFGGDVAYQGKYIRWNNCLNLPCPGTGLPGDPNVSIFITPEIQQAVRLLVGD